MEIIYLPRLSKNRIGSSPELIYTSVAQFIMSWEEHLLQVVREHFFAVISVISYSKMKIQILCVRGGK